MIEHMSKERFPYEDIINLPHYTSKKHPCMPRKDRAAQFGSFAALTGHEEAIKESERLTGHRIELDEEELRQLNETFQKIKIALNKKPKNEDLSIKITYYLPDQKKEGGRYETVCSKIKKMKEYEELLVLEHDTMIPFNDIFRIELIEEQDAE